MQLQNLNKQLNSLDRTSVKKKRINYLAWAIRLVVVIILLFVAIYLPARRIYAALKQVKSSAALISAGAKQENLDLMKQGVTQTQTSLEELNSSLNWLFWLRAIPVVGGYYADAKHFATAGNDELAASQMIINDLYPYKNELGLNGTQVVGQDRVSQALKILNKILPDFDKLDPELQAASDEVAQVDTSKYPEKYGSTLIRSRLDEAKNFIIGAHIAVTQGKDVLSLAPSMLGQPNSKTYLVLFQNDKELRATGGFITAYTFLKIDNGHLSTTGSDDIYSLDEKLLSACQYRVCDLTPPLPIVKYLPEPNGKPKTAWSLRDSNLSPDFPTSAQQFEKMYKYLGNGLPFDGIIAIDTNVLQDLISITGPVEMGGVTYSNDINKTCNCSDIIYQLESYSEIAAAGQVGRKAILGGLMQEVLARALGSGSSKLPDLINVGVNLASSKDVMFYMHDQPTEAALAKLGWTGQITNTNGDYLNINNSNFAGGKSNLYVESNVTYNITHSSDGKLVAKLDINYKNPQPANIWLNNVLRDYIRIYVPKGATLVSSDGSDVKVTTSEDDALDKTYFEAFITVRPQNSRTISFKYQLPDSVGASDYQLLIQKQPGEKNDPYTIQVDGNTKQEFDLTSDKTLKLSL